MKYLLIGFGIVILILAIIIIKQTIKKSKYKVVGNPIEGVAVDCLFVMDGIEPTFFIPQHQWSSIIREDILSKLRKLESLGFAKNIKQAKFYKCWAIEKIVDGQKVIEVIEKGEYI